MGRARLRCDEIFTLFFEAENVINFRTLGYISDNTDESFNTPYQFIYGYQPNKKCFVYGDIDDINGENIG